MQPPLFWRVREFNSTDAGYPVPAGLCAREQTQLQLIYRYRRSLRVLDNSQPMIAFSSFQFHQPEMQNKATVLLIFNCCCVPLNCCCLLILDKVIFEFLQVKECLKWSGVPLKGCRRYDCSTNHLGLFSFCRVFVSCVLKYLKQCFILQDWHVLLAEPTKLASVTRRPLRPNHHSHYSNFTDNKSYPSRR